MTTHVLQVDEALRQLSIACGRDRSVESRYAPYMCPKNRDALRNYFEKLDAVMEDPAHRGWGIHVSEISGEEGWECDRWIWYCLNGIPEETWKDDALIRTWWMGDGVHFCVFPRIVPALLFHYGNRIEILEVKVEVSIPAGPNFLRGTPDFVLRYRLDGRSPETVVIDVKSTSASMHEKRVKGRKHIDKANRQREIENEVQYERQVAIYTSLLEADYGLLLYWVKQYPHDFEQSVIRYRPAIIRSVDRRIETVIDNNDVAPEPRSGPHCLKCKFYEQCWSETRRK